MIEKPKHGVSRIARLSILLLTASVAACGRSVVMLDQHESMTARQVLVVALEAWKGKHIQALSERDPPIHFSDEDFTASTLLIDYEIESQLDEAASTSPLGVELVLQNEPGKTMTKHVAYDISLEPEPSVNRRTN